MNKELFKQYNIKMTKQRVMVYNSIEKLDTKANINNIYNFCANEVDKSTVYRILEVFIKNNIIDKKIIDNDTIYILKDNHEHFITCTKCHKKTKIKNCHFEEIEKEIEEENGYLLTTHSIELSGICNHCRGK